MGCGEISAARGIEEILDSVEVEKESVAASTGEERVGAGLDDVGFDAEGDLGIGDDLRPNSFDRAGFRAFCHEDVDGLHTVLRWREHVTDRDVSQAVSVVINVEAVDGVRMERVGSRVCIEDDHSPRRVSGRLERVEVAEVESLVLERGAEIESSKMVRHFFLLKMRICFWVNGAEG